MTTALRLTADIPAWRPRSREFGGNARLHRFARAKLAKVARKKVCDALMVAGWPRELPPGRHFQLTFHVYVKGGRFMDSDNAVAVLKECRDAVAAYLGTYDGPTGPIRWRYSYLTGPEDRVVLVLKELPG